MYFLKKYLIFILFTVFSFEAWCIFAGKKENKPKSQSLGSIIAEKIISNASESLQKQPVDNTAANTQLANAATSVSDQKQAIDEKKKENDEAEKAKKAISDLANAAINGSFETKNSSDMLENTTLDAIKIDTEQDPVQKIKLLFDESNLILNNVLTKQEINKIPNMSLSNLANMFRKSINNFNRNLKNKRIIFKSPVILNLVKRSGKLNDYLAANKLLDRFKIIKSLSKNLLEEDFMNRSIQRLKTEISSYDRSIEKQVALTNVMLEYEKISRLFAIKPDNWTLLFRDFNEKDNSIKYLFDFQEGCQDFFRQEEEE